jgi:hypothetical protein
VQNIRTEDDIDLNNTLRPLSTYGPFTQTWEKMQITVNGYPTNAPSPLMSPSDERTKKFKCPVNSCGSLVVITPLVVSTLYNVLWSDSRSGPLHNYVLIYTVSSSF